MDRSRIDHDGLRLFEELLQIPAPSGREEALAEAVRGKLEAWGLRPETDAAGNVMVRVEGSQEGAPTVCLAAHLDEIGMVVTQIEPDGSLRVTRAGGLFPWKLGEGVVDVLGDNATIQAAVSMGSGHSKMVVAQERTWETVRVLTGRSPSSLAEAGVRIGSPMVPVRGGRGPFVFGDEADPMVAAWTFDNRLGVVVLLQVLQAIADAKLQPICPHTFAFTVEEEIGCHGAKILAQRERPDVFIAVDGSPLVPECPIPLDGRPGIRSKDRVASYDQDLFRDLCRLSASAGVELLPVVYDGAASDASMAYATGATPRAGCLGYVRASSHGFEVAPLSTFDKLLTAVSAFVAGWDG